MAAFNLNKEQQSAVYHTEGPVLILAGAGSGKTRVLTQRIAHLISEKNVAPWNILAITFTNKAAKEMKERIEQTSGKDAGSVFVATFHSTCVRILRKYADRLGYSSSFSIYDSEDQKTLIKKIAKRFAIETRDLKPKSFLSKISSAKDHLLNPSEYMLEHQYDRDADKIITAYREYQKALFESNAMDFDDLIMKTVELFRKNPDVLEEYQERFKYICVDEYQDTNHAQFVLVKLLADKYRNLCVVGDDDQSIYRFRGANIRNILDFETVYPDAFVVKLEQNYRSTQNILDAANAVIGNNKGRKAKKLWSDLGEGALIKLRQFRAAFDEALFIAEDIDRKMRRNNLSYSDFAVLYRTNAQSRLIEERFVHGGIPYELVGGVNFYSRKEIKDIIAYLKTIDNARDDIAVTRIINIPKRGIGATTIEKVTSYALNNGISFFDALERADEILSAAASAKVSSFVALINDLRDEAREGGIENLISELVQRIDYEDYLISLTDEALKNEEDNERMKNVQELVSKAAAYDDEAEAPSLSDFLEEVALVADIDRNDDNSGRVMLMTLHSAKGLEFPYVYLSGMEEGIFPSFQACQTEDFDKQAMEEERRLAYVGLTRAKKDLTLTSARARMTNGETRYNVLSRFATEIPSELLETDTDGSTAIEAAKTARISRAENAGRREYHFGGAGDYSFKRAERSTSDFSAEALGKALPSKGMPTFGKPDYNVGDRVNHVKFGEGTVTALEETPRDYKVSVNFDKAGEKVMYAAFAKLIRL